MLMVVVLLSAATGAAAQSAAYDVITFETGKTPAREIHVATTGNDTTGDGTVANPYRTINRGVQAATPGTAIRIHAGVYAARVNINDLAGTADAPIWIGGAPGEAKPIIENVSEGMHLTRVHYVIVHDLEVRNTSDNGINADDGGDYANFDATRHVLFRNLFIHHVGSGGNQDCLKLSGVNNYFVLDSEFSFCGGGASGSGIDHVGCHNGLIVGNYLHDLSANAIQAKGGSANIEIRANRMVNSGERAVNIGGSTGFQYFRPPLLTTQPNFEARNIRVIANVIEGSIAPLAFVGAVDSLAANNTVVNPTNWLIRILQETTTSGSYQFLACANNTVINNLFYFDRSDLSTYVNTGPNTAPTTFVFSNNLWYAHNNPAQSQPNLPVTETNGIVGQNPRLINPASGDYHLQSNSPAIAHGQPVPDVTTDYDGVSYNHPPSIGAFEFLPQLSLHGTPRSHAIDLSWTVSAVLPLMSTWRISYYSQTAPITIGNIVSTTRAYQLNGLTNYAWYTVTVNTMLGTTPFLTATVQLLPTDRLVYLPIVLK
jgi:hypothetical protein